MDLGNGEEHMKVLVVDDNSLTRNMLSHFLSAYGYEVTSCEDGAAALKIYEQDEYPLVITDIVMPQMDGLELSRRIRSLPQGDLVVILGITSHESPEMLEKVLDAGADDYLPKPDLTDSNNIRLFQIRLRIAEQQVIDRFKRKQTEEALKKYTEELEILNYKLIESEKNLKESNATKDKFFSIISHDLRTPFTVLLGTSQLLDRAVDRLTRNDIRERVRGVRIIAEKTFALLENLLNWARLQHGQMECQPKRIELQEVVSQNIDLLTEKAKQKRIDLSHYIGANVLVYGDENMIKAILRNLISNALKFTDKNGKVKISANVNSNFVEILVQDNGIGISKENLTKLFRIDEKYRVEGTAGEKGTGLGLILCKELVERNGGKIWVESEADVGTTFRFTLPKMADT